MIWLRKSLHLRDCLDGSYKRNDLGLLEAMTQLRVACARAMCEVCSGPTSPQYLWSADYWAGVVEHFEYSLRAKLVMVGVRTMLGLGMLAVANVISYGVAKRPWLPFAFVVIIALLSALPRQGSFERIISLSTMSAAFFLARYWAGFGMSLSGIISMACSLLLVLRVLHDTLKLITEADNVRIYLSLL